MKKIFSTFNQKWPEYLIEAIVIIASILGAFALDNWNENRVNKKEEQVLLIDLRNDLVKTIKELKQDTLSNSINLKSAKRIAYYINHDLPYALELDSCFGNISGWSSPYVISSAYQSLQSEGIKIIENRALRNAIVNLYDEKLAFVKDDYDRSEWVYFEAVIMPYFSKNILRLNDEPYRSARPNDYEKLKKSNEFLNILSMIIHMRKLGLNYYQNAILEIQSVINMINQELEK